MNKSIKEKSKKNIYLLTLLITVIFIIINISLYIINNDYLVKKIKEENEAFVEITTHIVEANDIETALVYVEHYTHIHKVDIKVYNDEGAVIFISDVNETYFNKYTITTTKGDFLIDINNKDSQTVLLVENNTIYVNVLLLIIYLLTLAVLIRNNKRNSQYIDEDIKNVIKLIDSEIEESEIFNYEEFKHIYNNVTKYLENIDLLTEQKSMNMKGLAHDVKTRLTVIYHYLNNNLKNKVVSGTETKKALEASRRIDSLLDDILKEDKTSNTQKFNIATLLDEKKNEYAAIFENKEIKIITDFQEEIFIQGSKKDLERIIDNIISNAFYYSKIKTEFKINIEQNQKTIMTFTSTPENILNIDVEKVFKKGVRGSLSHQNNNYGKGYGLYICRLLLEPMGGSITMSKENKNIKVTIIL